MSNYYSAEVGEDDDWYCAESLTLFSAILKPAIKEFVWHRSPL